MVTLGLDCLLIGLIMLFEFNDEKKEMQDFYSACAFWPQRAGGGTERSGIVRAINVCPCGFDIVH
jgi:hypothetical protein